MNLINKYENVYQSHYELKKTFFYVLSFLLVFVAVPSFIFFFRKQPLLQSVVFLFGMIVWVFFSLTLVVFDSLEEFFPVGDELEVSVISLSDCENGYMVRYVGENQELLREHYFGGVVINNDIKEIKAFRRTMKNSVGNIAHSKIVRVEAPKHLL